MAEQAKFNSDAKVVHLAPESHRIVRAKLARLPAAVHEVHEKGKALAQSLLRAFFDQADDSLFALADKAGSNKEQNLYFDAMREVRVRRRGVEKQFADAIDDAFAELVDSVEESETIPTLGADALAMADQQDLEDLVAAEDAISRANETFGELILSLSRNLDSLVPAKVYQKNNPLGPDVVYRAFMTVLKRLDVGIKAKLVLFDLFDKTVIRHLDDVYTPVNEILREHKVSAPISSEENSDHSDRSVTRENGGHQQTSPPSRPKDASQDSEVMSTLENMLAQAQHVPAAKQGDTDALRNLIQEAKKQSGQDSELAQVDDQVINLVHLLFEFILDNKNLAEPMKSLISRMQIPVIKIAVVDKSFFTKGNHVARRLLNEMASAAIGWSGGNADIESDPLYQKLESIVRRLSADGETSTATFAEALADLNEFVEEERKQAVVLERRTVDAEDGKARAEVARSTIELEIELRTHEQPLPEVVQDLIKNAWSNVLFVAAIKYGYESDEWHASLSTLEDLVWSVQPPRNAEQRQQLIKLVPTLLKRLRKGMDTISYNPFEMSGLMKRLEGVHISCIRGAAEAEEESEVSAEVDSDLPQAASRVEEETVSEQEPPSLQENEPSEPVAPEVHTEKVDQSGSDTDQDFPEVGTSGMTRDFALDEFLEVDKLLETDAIIPEAPQSAAAPEPEVQARTAAATPVDAITPEPAVVTPVAETLPDDDPFMIQVSGFSQGAWFDIKGERDENIRCRLAAFIKPTGKYIFVNRNGVKVAEKTQVDLALAMRAGRLRTLDDKTLFDKALETVVTGLRKK